MQIVRKTFYEREYVKDLMLETATIRIENFLNINKIILSSFIIYTYMYIIFSII